MGYYETSEWMVSPGVLCGHWHKAFDVGKEGTEPAIQLLLLHVEDKHSTVLSALAEDENFLLLLKVGNCSLPVYSPQGEFDSLSL